MVKKRYHQSKRDRMHESHDMHKHMMKEHHHSHPDGHHMMSHVKYDGPEMRRHMEMMDGGMIREDHSAIANLPQGVMMKPYPMTGPYMPEGLDDTIRGVDKQMDSDDSQRARHFRPHKY